MYQEMALDTTKKCVFTQIKTLPVPHAPVTELGLHHSLVLLICMNKSVFSEFRPPTPSYIGSTPHRSPVSSCKKLFLVYIRVNGLQPAIHI